MIVKTLVIDFILHLILVGEDKVFINLEVENNKNKLNIIVLVMDNFNLLVVHLV